MATVNQLQPIESILTPDESNWFRKNAPHFLDALRLQQTVINQLVVRVGGSGPGTGTNDLDELTGRVDDIDDDLSELGEIVDPSSPALFHAEHALTLADQAMIMASESGLHGQIAEIRARIEAIEYQSGDLQLIAQISDLRARIEALENVSNA